MVDFVETGYIDLPIIKQLMYKLPRAYRDLPATVIIDPDAEIMQAIQQLSESMALNITEPNNLALFIPELNYIFVMPSHFRRFGETSRYRIIHSFLHELRHAWQLKHRPRKWPKDIIDPLSINQKTYDQYRSQWIEQDAEKWATKMLHKFIE